MANWNQRTANYIKGQINTWTEEFLSSSLGNVFEAEKTTEMIQLFADKMYETHLRTPKTWIGYGVKETLQTDFSTELSEAKTTLEAFFNFLGEKEYIKNASTLINALHEVATENTEAPKETTPVAKKATPAPKEKTVETSTKDASSKNPFNQWVKERNHQNKLLGKKKKRKKHQR